jgi:putative nucleotidyltransferase with HDIG domain
MLGRARSLESFAATFVATLAGLSTVLDRRRPYTVGHHAAVTSIALEVGSAVGLSGDDLEVLRMAASIHDVGMAAAGHGVREALTSDTEHPTIGAALVSALPVPPAVATTIGSHHEWWDGWGFPNGSSGADIPLPGRVLALAEFVAEMAAPDPVRAAWPAERIAEELLRRRGSQFDPAVVDAALPLTARAAVTVADLLKEFA